MVVTQLHTHLAQLSGHSQQTYSDLVRHLKSLGANWYDLQLPETHALPHLIHADETIIGIVYGRYVEINGGRVIGRGVLVATDQRVLLIDKKPLFVRSNEIIYHVISAVTYSKAGPAGTLVLHTRMGEISLRTFNQKCAHGFVEAVESIIFNELSGV